jgi:hypothetical protein
MKRVDHRHIDQVIGLAVTAIPLDQVGSGPADELGVGPQYQIHRCLGFIVQDLKRFPGSRIDRAA